MNGFKGMLITGIYIDHVVTCSHVSLLLPRCTSCFVSVWVIAPNVYLRNTVSDSSFPSNLCLQGICKLISSNFNTGFNIEYLQL